LELSPSTKRKKKKKEKKKEKKEKKAEKQEKKEEDKEKSEKKDRETVNVGIGEKGANGQQFEELLNIVFPMKNVRVEGGIEAESTYIRGDYCLDHIFYWNVEVDFDSFCVHKDWTDVVGVPISDHFGVSVSVSP